MTSLAWYIVFLFSTTLHEAAHAAIAKLSGDNTAYFGGQVSVNPLPHIRREPVGMVVLPLISAFAYGWPLGFASTPYDRNWAERYPGRSAIMALAGPLSNLLIVIISGLLIVIGLKFGTFTIPEMIRPTGIIAGNGTGASAGFAMLISMLFTMNLLLAMFNLLPFPPLDGSAILLFLIGENAREKYKMMMGQPAITLIAIFLSWRLIGMVFPPVFFYLVSLLYTVL